MGERKDGWQVYKEMEEEEKDGEVEDDKEVKHGTRKDEHGKQRHRGTGNKRSSAGRGSRKSPSVKYEFV
ncbi:hypothetical protein E2C01_027750 [Portunus trituberculatus]|uniref:Uncharacterized protein n=1 Tax=Portunus trituberculatus TaxID=210409 RepID=A0A5B7ELQ5_PORTR|nr:hypothetical protein [Portunus trituberculatus]